RSSVEERVTALENLVRKFSNAEERVECKKLKRELEEAGLSNILLHMQNKRVERDLYWTRFRAHEGVDAAIAAERARQANAENYASGSGLARGQVTTSVVR
ncbi:hypothetical protein Tco_0114167, partial [Tanacetum coccineum]